MGPTQKDKGYGWLIVLASFMIQFIGLGINSTFGLFYIEISKEFPEVGKSGTSWIPSIMTALAHLSGPGVSMLVNKFGLRIVSITGSLLSALGFGLGYFATNAGTLDLTVGIAGGIGIGMMYLPAMVAIPRYFDQKLALATGICVCGSGFGTLFFEWTFGLMLRRFSWQESLVIAGGIFFASFPLGLLYKPREDKNDVNDPLLGSSQTIHFPKKKKLLLIDLCLFKNILFTLFAISELFASFAFNIPQVYLPDIEHRLTQSNANSLLGYIAAPMILSRLLLGYLSDKKLINRYWLYTIAVGVTGIVTAISPHLDSLGLLRGYCAIFGVCIGIYLGLKSVILVDLVAADKFTDSFGLILLVQSIGMLFGAPVAGEFYDTFENYKGGFYFAGIMFAMSSIVLSFIPRVKRKKEEKTQDTHPSSIIFSCKSPGYSTFKNDPTVKSSET